MANFTTAAKVKSFFSISDTSIDSLIAELLPRIDGEIKDYCGRDLMAGTYTEYHNGEGHGVLFLNQCPITAITSIHDDTDRVFGTDTLLDSDDYIFIAGSQDSKAGILRLDGGVFCRGYSNIKVVYTAGFSSIATEAPSIEQAANLKIGAELMLTKFIFNAPIIDGDGFIKDPGSMKKRAEELLRPYRRLV